MGSTKFKDQPRDTLWLINNSLPFLFLGLALLVWLSRIEFTPQEKQDQYWIARVLLLNSAHVVFSFSHLLFLPEYRQILKQKDISISRHLWILVLLCALLFWNDLNKSKAGYGATQNLILGFLFLSGYYHIWRQSLGLSLLLNTKDVSVGSFHPGAMESSQKLEKASCYFGVLGSFVLESSNGWFAPVLPYKLELRVLAGVLFAITLLLFGLSMLRIRSHPAFRPKFLFNARILLRIFQPVSWICLLGALAVHGVEYFWVDRQVRRNSRILPQAARMMVVATLFLALIKIQLDHPAQVGQWIWLSQGPLTSFLNSLGMALTVYHYYLDGIFYRFSDPAIRQAIRPLLKVD